MNLRSVALLAAIALAACSGGGGGSATAPPIVPDRPSAPTPAATLTLTFHPNSATSAAGKKPAYVSPSSTQITVTVNTVNGSAPPAWVPTPVTTALTVGSNCTLSGGTETCTIPVAAPPGTVNFTFALGDGTTTLSTWTGDETIVQGIVNAFSITLQGIVGSVSVFFAGSPLAANVNLGSETLTVMVRDARGNLIVAPGSYNNPITLTDNDATLQTKLSLNGGTPASSIVVSAPSDVVTLTYAGQAVNSFTISATAAGGVSGSGTISSSVNDVTFPSGTTLDDAAHGGLITDSNWGQQTVFFAQASGTQNIIGSELGWTNAPYGRQFDVTLSAACATGNIASISSGPGTSFTVTATGGVGVCSGRLTEHGTGYPITGHATNSSGSATHDGTFWISVTTSSFGVNHTRR